MLSKEQIEQNKNEFLNLISQINIEGADTQGLVEFLLSSDFFIAPASTKYHCNFDGGTCYHSLKVYKLLDDFCEKYYPGKYSKNSKLICGLLHDISKADFYEKDIRNKKVYSDKGSKQDNMGRFDWFAEESYKVKEAADRLIAGNHGFNSVVSVGRFIPLSLEETIAIQYHMLNSDDKAVIYDMSDILNKYHLLTCLYLADFTSTFILENE